MSARIDPLVCQQRRQPTGGVAEHRSGQQPAGHEPVCHLIEVLKPVVLALVDTSAGVAAVLEPDRVSTPT
jgi:hypothetical protein